MDLAELHAFMSRHRYGIASSIADDGTPQSALVGISVSSKLEIVFDRVKSSRKYPNLISRPCCALVLGGMANRPQYEGVATESQGEERARYREIYFQTWPDGRDRLGWTGLVHLVVSPQWIRYSDFDQNPRLIQEWKLANGSLLP